MSWKIKDIMAIKEELVVLGQQEGCNFSELCKRLGISRWCGYKWLKRYQQQGREGLKEQSRKRKRQSGQTPQQVESLILELREAHPNWGPRKLKRRLEDLGHRELPAFSTISAILKRNGYINKEDPSSQGPWKRFSYEQPNELWQMDFKGQFTLIDQKWCYPFTVLDDHSRYSLAIKACSNQKGVTIKEHLTELFKLYGLPNRILADYGTPWGCSQKAPTRLEVWLLQLGVELIHGRASHPQTQGKIERFHRTLKAEVLSRTTVWYHLEHVQGHFDRFRYCYNTQRPHQALNFEVPARYYQPSKRSMPAVLPTIEYLHNDQVRLVKGNGCISFKGYHFCIGEAFATLPIALRQTATDGLWDVFFSWKRLGSVNLKLLSKSNPALFPLDL